MYQKWIKSFGNWLTVQFQWSLNVIQLIFLNIVFIKIKLILYKFVNVVNFVVWNVIIEHANR